MLKKIHSTHICYGHMLCWDALLISGIHTVVTLNIGVDEEVGLAESARARGGTFSSSACWGEGAHYPMDWRFSDFASNSRGIGCLP